VKRLVIITGLSGFGESRSRARCLEDMDYFCVDNLPVSLIPQFHELLLRSGEALPRAAIVVDAREREFLTGFPAELHELRAKGRAGHAPVLRVHRRDPEAAASARRAVPHPMQDAGGLARRRRCRDERADPGAPAETSRTGSSTRAGFNAHELRAFLKAGVRQRRGGERAERATSCRSASSTACPAEADLLLRHPLPPEPRTSWTGLASKDGRHEKSGRSSTRSRVARVQPPASRGHDRLPPPRSTPRRGRAT
jgi:RNase adaptor protein for sRNA GlmZ degradation